MVLFNFILKSKLQSVFTYLDLQKKIQLNTFVNSTLVRSSNNDFVCFLLPLEALCNMYTVVCQSELNWIIYFFILSYNGPFMGVWYGLYSSSSVFSSSKSFTHCDQISGIQQFIKRHIIVNFQRQNNRNFVNLICCPLSIRNSINMQCLSCS